jgi:hypothetical protein
MFNPFEEEYVKQVQRIRDLKAQKKFDEAALEENTLASINQYMGKEDLADLDEKTQLELEVVYD